MKQKSLGARLRYWFDRTLARGPIALIGWLFAASAALLALLVTLIMVSGNSPPDANGHATGVGGVAWIGLLSTLDTGEIENVSGSHMFLGLTLVSTLGGIFLASTLIGVLSTALSERLEALRKGRSLVLEEGHTVILGWSPHIFTLLNELSEANRNQRHAAVAVLAPRDKVAMEDEIRDRVTDPGRLRIICRTGDPIDLTDLEIVNPHRARAIIMPSPEVPEPDVQVIKTILALVNNPRRRPEPYHIVAELQDSRNIEVARLVGKDEAQIISAPEIVARIAAQTCRQSGLSVVYTELFDFGGDEIYFQREPALVGRTFSDALMAYEDSAVIGLRLADGSVQLNPAMSTVITDGDAIVAISADDDTVRVSPTAHPAPELTALVEPDASIQPQERTLILGWNRSAPLLINELDHYVAPGSALLVVTEDPAVESELALHCGGVQHLQISFRAGDPTDRRLLDELEIPSYDHLITLSPQQRDDVQAADARSLITLIHLRDIATRHDRQISIVSEMLDVRNRQLAEATRADDFIVSNVLVSLMLTQLAENRELLPVFTDLLDADGSELYLKPVESYVQCGRPLTFYTVVEAARRRGEVAIGYRLLAQSGDKSAQYGVRVNPRKSETVTFAAGDKIIVVAED